MRGGTCQTSRMPLHRVTFNERRVASRWDGDVDVMRYLGNLTRRRSTRLLAASALVIGVGGGTMAASSASAAACDRATFAANCTMTGTATVTGGSLGVAAPAAQTWATTLDGTDKQLVDTYGHVLLCPGLDRQRSWLERNRSGDTVHCRRQLDGSDGHRNAGVQRQHHRRNHRRDPGQRLCPGDHLHRADPQRDLPGGLHDGWDPLHHL